MFWRKKKPTLTEQAVTALDDIVYHIEKLKLEREFALSSFRETADKLAMINDDLGEKAMINDDLGEKAALCGSLVAQLGRAQESISKQCEDNDRVRCKILDIIGE